MDKAPPITIKPSTELAIIIVQLEIIKYTLTEIDKAAKLETEILSKLRTLHSYLLELGK